MKYSFGDVIVDPQTLVIQVAGKEKRLEPKLIALLTYLTQHSQQVLSRQQITEAVWPKVVVVDESVTQAIFALRNALNDDAKRPRYIETIPRRGYRFLAEVNFAQTEEIQAELTPPTASPRHVRKAYVGLALSLALLLGLVLVWINLRSQSLYEIANIRPFTTMAGAECCMAINGERKMVFINVLGNNKDLFVKDVRSGVQQRVTQDDWRKGIPLWRDNNTLIYPRCANNQCQIVQQSLNQSPQVIYTSHYYIGEITLTPDNPDLLIFNQKYKTSEFMMFDLRSGNYEPLRKRYPDLPPHIIHPILAKDASKLYFVNVEPKPVLMVLDLTTKTISSVSDQFDDINSFSIDDRQQFMIAGSHKSTAGIWLLNNTSNLPRLILRATGDEKLQFPLWDPIDKILYYQSVVFDQNIGMTTQNSNRFDDFSELNSTGMDNLPTLSKDEQFLYFISNRSGFSEVWRYDLATKQTKNITRMKFTGVSSVLVSNDGQRFSATYIDNMQATLGVFSVHNGELLASVKTSSRPLSWSPDDQTLYAQDKSNNVSVLMAYNSQTLADKKIQDNAGLVAQESADGKSLIFFDTQRNSLLERNIASGQDQHLLSIDLKEEGNWIDMLAIDGNSTSLFVIKHREIRELWQYPFKSQNLTPRKTLDLPKDTWITFVNADGSIVLYDKSMPPSGSIMKINFH